LQLPVGASQNWPPAVPKHIRAYPPGLPLDTGEIGCREAGPLLDRLAQQDRGQRQCQREPEAAAEHLDAVTGVLVVRGMLAGPRAVTSALPRRMLGMSADRIVAAELRIAGVSSAVHPALPCVMEVIANE